QSGGMTEAPICLLLLPQVDAPLRPKGGEEGAHHPARHALHHPRLPLPEHAVQADAHPLSARPGLGPRPARRAGAIVFRPPRAAGPAPSRRDGLCPAGPSRYPHFKAAGPLARPTPVPDAERFMATNQATSPAPSQLFARKALKALLAEAEGDNRLKRVLGPVTLTSLGVGAVIGAGIFVATGAAAKDVAGPALMISYMVAGVTCIFAALCYAEFASMAPVAGSAYTYAYTTLGELFAWIIGWDLVLEYAVGAATLANRPSRPFPS